MRKLGNVLLVLGLALVCCWLGTVLADRERLHDDLIRFHVVANSDSAGDQELKLQVRDAVIARLDPVMERIPDVQQAKEYLQAHLQDLEETANQALRQAGSQDTAKVTLQQEAFPTRAYDTFSLPAGVYDSLRIVIGEGEGKNWWCVVFPQLCLSATSEGFQDTAVSSGFSDSLAEALTGDYELRFFLLDCLGQVENFFHKS